MIVYYRFAGFVACMALAFNLLLVLALMVLIKAAFTLPGLAGLVLTIGMSVDANVLIYERIREELRSGAALRMAIRNGFGRAMSAIIDSNVTTIIAGIALFYIGTDQVKGFAVTLILGILTSMFTAIFFARLMFDVAERRGWIKKLKMMKICRQPNFDFLGVRWLAGGASLVVIAIGMVAVYFRGAQMLDIDFTGGSSVTFALNDDGQDADRRKFATRYRDTELADKNLVVVELGKTNTRYSVDTSEQSVDDVKEIVTDDIRRQADDVLARVQRSEAVHGGRVHRHRGDSLPSMPGRGYEEKDGISHDALRDWLQRILEEQGHQGIQPTLTNPELPPRQQCPIQGVDRAARRAGRAGRHRRVFEQLQADMHGTPLFPLANKIGGRVSADMQTKALLAIAVSLVGVIGYLWLRFQKVTYGLAAGAALVHDVLVTIGMMALSAYIVSAVPALADALQIGVVPDQPHDRGRAADDHRLLAQRHDRHVRPPARDQGQDAATSRPKWSTRASINR